MSEQEPLLSGDNDNQYAGHPDTNTGILKGERNLTVWRTRMAEFLENPRLHKTVIALIIVDAGCVLIDLGYTILSPTCTPIEGENAPLWLKILSYISLTITTLFLIEIPMTLWAFGFKAYNPSGPVSHASLHLFDALVILTTFILEVVLRGKERELAGLLVILRLWRLVKLVGGIAVGAGEIQEDTTRLLKNTQTQLAEANSALALARRENQELKSRIMELES